MSKHKYEWPRILVDKAILGVPRYAGFVNGEWQRLEPGLREEIALRVLDEIADYYTLVPHNARREGNPTPRGPDPGEPVRDV